MTAEEIVENLTKKFHLGNIFGIHLIGKLKAFESAVRREQVETILKEMRMFKGGVFSGDQVVEWLEMRLAQIEGEGKNDQV